jgi:hypothetical protein
MASSLLVSSVLSIAALANAAIPPGGQPDIVTFEVLHASKLTLKFNQLASLSLTQAGQVMGVRMPNANLRYWYAVPFAEPTNGTNAWYVRSDCVCYSEFAQDDGYGLRAPPVVRGPWSFVMDVTQMGAGCPQTHHNPDVPKNEVCPAYS